MAHSLRGILTFALPLPLDSFLPFALVSYGMFFLLREAHPNVAFAGPLFFTIAGLLVTVLDSPLKTPLRTGVRTLLLLAPFIFVAFI